MAAAAVAVVAGASLLLVLVAPAVTLALAVVGATKALVAVCLEELGVGPVVAAVALGAVPLFWASL
jgi:hypothetical protein